MMLAAHILGDKEIIFPEIAAFLTGFWVIDKHVWNASRVQMIVLSVLMAVLGTCLVLYFPELSDTEKLLITLCTGAMLLSITKTDIYPILSAAALPVVLNVGSWIYPISVVCLCLCTAIVQHLMEKTSLRTYNYRNDKSLQLKTEIIPTKEYIRLQAIQWIKIIPCITLISYLAFTSGHRYIILPPLIVCFVEFTKIGSGVRKQPYLIVLLIFIAALIGTFSTQILHLQMGLPIYLSSLIAVLCVFTLFEVFERRFAPAAAICLVPNILPLENQWNFPIEVSIGAAALIIIALMLFPNTSSKNY